MKWKQDIRDMLFIVCYIIFISSIILFYLQRKFVFSTLLNEVQQLRIKKEKVLDEIDKIKLQIAKYSSIERMNQLLPEEIASNKFVEQKIITLKIPNSPTLNLKKEKKLENIIQHKYLSPLIEK